MEMLFVRGDGVILVRTSFSVLLVLLSLPLYLRYHPLHGRNFLHQVIVLDTVQSCMLFFKAPWGFEAQHAHYSWVIIRVLGC